MALTKERTGRAPVLLTRYSKLLTVVGIIALVVGTGSIAGGVFGVFYTWNQAVQENITTPEDAVIPDTPVRGPFTMWAQADIIEEHTLNNTGGLRYSEMPRQVPQLDEQGNPVLDENGEPVMVPNQARNLWVTATTLITALNLGIIAYALSGLAIAVGVGLVAAGIGFLALRKQQALT